MKEAMSGGLVDFKENLLFEEYKDQPLRGAKSFKRRIKDKYGFRASSDLYARLINYQVEKYGEPIVAGSRIAYIPIEARTSTLVRKHNNERQKEYYEYEKLLRRTDERKGIKKAS